MESELRIDFPFYSFWREDAFTFVLTLWSEKAQWSLNAGEHISRNLMHVRRQNDWRNEGRKKEGVFLWSQLFLISIRENGDKTEWKDQGKASRRHTLYLPGTEHAWCNTQCAELHWVEMFYISADITVLSSLLGSRLKHSWGPDLSVLFFLVSPENVRPWVRTLRSCPLTYWLHCQF